MITETEIWRTVIIKGEIYDNYQVSNFGQILSLNYHRSGKPRLLKHGKNTQGYPIVSLCKNGKRKNFTIHRLVAEAFLSNPDNLPQVNHKDENKTNNRVDNLEWCTNEYNINYGTRTEKTSKPVLQFSKTGEFVREWSSISECGRNGFVVSAVCSCCNGERNFHKGYIWKYKE